MSTIADDPTRKLERSCVVAAEVPQPAENGSAAKALAILSTSMSLNENSLRELENAYAGTTPPESVRMLLAVVRGSRMGPGEGWFGPADQRYTWKWLTTIHGMAETDAISADQFHGTAAWFSRLDRNQDGWITQNDLDWSEQNPWIQQAYLINRIFRRIESDGDGRLTREDLSRFFEAAANGKDFLLSDDLRDALLGQGDLVAYLPGDAPSQEVLIRGLFSGELGSLNEGPSLNSRAPDFSLMTHDGSQTVRLAEFIGPKPVVLTFGNFTCGPFRSLFPGVEQIHKRFESEATFLAVYVREAHPTDGWKMESNRRLGVAVAQPQTFTERTAVANQCHRLLKPSMPLLVDEINDPVGHAYSGMPARMYIVDRDGLIAYKSGRGPFGFKAGEMEQALVLTLLDQQSGRASQTGATRESNIETELK